MEFLRIEKGIPYYSYLHVITSYSFGKQKKHVARIATDLQIKPLWLKYLSVPYKH